MFIRPCEGRITSRFQKDRLDPVGQKEYRDHVGTDFAKSGMVPIRASASGLVTLARNADTDGFGKVVFIEHNLKEGKFITIYAHLSNVSVRTGQTVSQGTIVGAMGSTGNSTGQHLHFEIHVNERFKDNRNAVDALMYIPLEVALKKGDKGPNVKTIQQLLVKARFLSTADGHFGDDTENAVKSFQKQNNLDVDGLAGPVTVSKLKVYTPTVSEKPVVPKPSKEVATLELTQTQRVDLANVYKLARTKGIFSSSEHEKAVLAGTMTQSKSIYLNGLIAGALLNNNVRV